MNIEVKQLIERWEAAARDALTGIADKDFRLLRKSWRTGNLCFRNFTKLGDNAINRISREEKQRFHTLMEKWNIISHEIEIWKSEIKEEIGRRKRQKRNDNKLNKIYKHKRTTGSSLKLKAR